MAVHPDRVEAVEWSAVGADAISSVDTAAGKISELIRRGELLPGQRLPAERVLCEQLGVGRNTLREGLRQLRAEGYVEVRRGPAGGTFVTDLRIPYEGWLQRLRTDPELLDELIDLRLAVERHLAWLAAQRITDEMLDSLTATVDDMDGAMAAGDFRRLDSAFHAIIAEAARSPRLARLMLTARSELFVAASTPMVDENGVTTTRHEHAAIIAALQARDADQAALAMIRHIEHTRADMSGVLWRKPADSRADST